MTKIRKSILPAAVIIAGASISILDTLSYGKSGNYSSIAATISGQIWLILLIYFFFFSLYLIVKIINVDLRQRKIWGIFALFFVTLLITFKLNSFPIDISGEATQEVAAGLTNFAKKDLGYAQNAFLGYPSRQYLITALPTELTNQRSIINYRLGFILPFILGIFLFYSGLNIYFDKRKNIHFIAALGVLAIVAFPVVLVIIRTFEQVILPLSFTLAATGVFLITAKKPNLTRVTALYFILTLLISTYTPALASAVLFIFLTAILLIKNYFYGKKITALLLFVCLFATTVSGINSILNRKDIRINLFREKMNYSALLFNSQESLQYFFIKNTDMYNNQLPFTGMVMSIPIILYLAGALTLRWKKVHFFIALWILGIIILSGQSIGYATPPPSLGIHRSIIIIPIVIAAMIDIISAYKVDIRFYWCSILFLTICCIAVYYEFDIYDRSQKYFELRSLVLRETIASAQKENINQEDTIQFAIYTSNPDFSLFQDHLRYFFPNIKIISYQAPCFSNLNDRINTIIFTDKKECLGFLEHNIKKINISDFHYKWNNREKSVKEAVYRSDIWFVPNLQINSF